MDPLLTGPQAAALCGVDPSTIRQWKRRGLITPDGLDLRGRPLYRQLTVARAEARTRQRAGRQLPTAA
ncbi:MerR family DNA-binding transcriptional regulator [Kitasatospora sp. NPDC092948]|uniref:MerR family DNA-binding transcriptional regulator n=1 Tax=Kitasatospora sp. NPDC092948 TaxID=3364088 RepID=UPI00380E0341